MTPPKIAILLYRVSRFLYRSELVMFAKAVKLIMMFLCSMEIDFRTDIGRNFHIYHGFGVVIGGGKIGDNVHINQGVTIGGNWAKERDGRTEPVIGNNVWIMSNTLVLGPVNIGNNVVLGANSLVNLDVPDNTLAAGTPARIIRKLTTHDVEILRRANKDTKFDSSR